MRRQTAKGSCGTRHLSRLPSCCSPDLDINGVSAPDPPDESSRRAAQQLSPKQTEVFGAVWHNKTRSQIDCARARVRAGDRGRAPADSVWWAARQESVMLTHTRLASPARRQTCSSLLTCTCFLFLIRVFMYFLPYQHTTEIHSTDKMPHENTLHGSNARRWRLSNFRRGKSINF